MTGIRALGIHLAFIVVPLALLCLVMVPIVGRWRKKKPWSEPGLLLLVTALMLFLVWGAYSFTQVAEGLYYLRHLDDQTVSSISFGEKTISDPRVISEIDSSLRHATWFSISHGGWGEPVQMKIKEKNGREEVFEAALYLRWHGAVILRRPSGRHIHTVYEYGYVSDLPETFARIGVALPTK
jgi:hypothetical protein